ncbi:conserved hypothetical protein [Roseibium sp. TrichSKD4]|uniref:hypothetical protein n=1 Tax=Roseibium sp. TrichSKD4 TaxID=744980 RepID=UPI0001E569B0|nr:hypothetical protein [Roseibium sp. TrichSKD4]EFO32483.1 conserved hypothetical protein [Roseibium sp. TrichSKD4]
MSILVSLGARLLGFLGGSAADRFLSHLERRAELQNGRERLKTEVTLETIRAELAARQAARDIVLAEQGWWVTALIRPAFAWPIVIWSGAVVADSLFQFSWNVAALPSPLSEWAGWIVGAYFLTRPFEKAARGFVTKGQKTNG